MLANTFPIALITTLFMSQLANVQFADGIDLDYEELVRINGSCKPLDTCDHQTFRHFADLAFQERFCTCDRTCSKFRTCCIDAPNKETFSPNQGPRCRRMKGGIESSFLDTGYYMVDKCPSSGKFDSIWKSSCEAEWKDADDAVLNLAPVTSLFTSMTYKNYFCFRCHETTNKFLYWDMVLVGRCNGSKFRERDLSKNNFILKYNHGNKTWTAMVGRDNASVPVAITFEIPTRMQPISFECDPDTIFECSDSWTDGSIQEKCNAYLSPVWFSKANGKYLKYRNAHCALCNFEEVRLKASSRPQLPTLHWEDQPEFVRRVGINRYDGDTVIPINQTCEENHVYDPYEKNCLKISCPNPGFVIREDKCVPRFYFQEYSPFYAFREIYSEFISIYRRMLKWFPYY